MEVFYNMDQQVSQLREERRRKYLIRGIAFAIASGMCYGLYTGFLTLAETIEIHEYQIKHFG